MSSYFRLTYEKSLKFTSKQFELQYVLKQSGRTGQNQRPSLAQCSCSQSKQICSVLFCSVSLSKSELFVWSGSKQECNAPRLWAGNSCFQHHLLHANYCWPESQDLLCPRSGLNAVGNNCNKHTVSLSILNSTHCYDFFARVLKQRASG